MNLLKRKYTYCSQFETLPVSPESSWVQRSGGDMESRLGEDLITVDQWEDSGNLHRNQLMNIFHLRAVIVTMYTYEQVLTDQTVKLDLFIASHHISLINN